MIVLDEQLLGRGLEAAIERWYPGRVVFIHALRPRSVIKDEAIPGLLAHVRGSTFVTINETDFWQRVDISPRFCLVCFSLSDAQVPQIPAQLRRLLRHPDLATRAKRGGKVVRVTAAGVQFYTAIDSTPRWLTTEER